MGNACEAGSIRIISMDFENKIQVHKPIDYCIGSVGINNNGVKERLTFKIVMILKILRCGCLKLTN